MKKTSSLLIIASLSVYCAFAQKSKADSLKIVLKTITTDTGRVSTLNLIAYEYIIDDPDQAH